ncbi:P-loop containing nucleoside triphosphate hydrolase protein [Hymenopellis radicata]|nr:P-loop containing nucleoside triphosphate hydrolase protein [Hymenopellis radicata]
MTSKRRPASPPSIGPQTPAKRRRVEEEYPTPPETSRKGKRRAQEQGSGGSETESSESESSDSDAEQDFEAEHRERIQASLKARQGLARVISEHGIIEQVEMHQFMCHKYLTFKMGPDVNFIIGRNGSGKSAVLSAITIALGGKSSSTGRGTGLKSFIREGQPASEVSIWIKNRGPEAFKPAVYGARIFITRKFSRNGSSSWKIKDKDGRVISTTRAELDAIRDYMNIQVDNPISVLTQDAARRFLGQADAKTKYDLFSTGTQLSRLHEEYQACYENVENIATVLRNREDVINDLRHEQTRAAEELELVRKVNEQRTAIQKLKEELTWAYVAEKESALERCSEEHAAKQLRLDQINERLDVAKKQLESHSEALRAKEQDLKVQDDKRRDLAKQKTDLRKQVRDSNQQLEEWKGDTREFDRKYATIKMDIEAIQSQIADEKRKLEAESQSQREKEQQCVEVAEAAVRAAQSALESADSEKAELDKRQEDLLAEQNNLTGRITEAERDVRNCQNDLRNFEEQEKNQYAPYGKGIREVLMEVKRTEWFGDTPVGPLGTFLTVHDPGKWANVLRRHMGKQLTSWAVTDTRDAKKLRRMLEGKGNRDLQVIIAERDMFDYSHGEPPDEYLTVLRALSISDPYVCRVLINQVGIERVFLARTRKEGQDRLRQYNRSGVAWTADGFLVRRYPEGGEMSKPIQDRRDATNLILSDSRTEMRKDRFEVELRNAQARLEVLRTEETELKRTIGTVSRALKICKTRESDAQRGLARARGDLQQSQDDADIDLPAHITALQDSLKEAEAERTALQTEFLFHNNQKGDLDTHHDQVGTELRRLEESLQALSKERDLVQERIEQAAQTFAQSQGNVKHYEDKRTRETVELEFVEKHLQDAENVFADTRSKAFDYCPPVATQRNPKEIQRLIDSTQAAVERGGNRALPTLPQSTARLNTANDRLESARAERAAMNALQDTLKRSLQMRSNRRVEFRRHIAVRCKIIFQFNMQSRGYFGRLEFKHDSNELEMLVTKDDAAAGGSQGSNASSLSGGEKSFSTLCFLLSLWDAISCPIRCLDEFDVFMDDINRKVAIKLLMDKANQGGSGQYIFITPKGLGDITVGPNVRVHKMSDPERRQGNLDF